MTPQTIVITGASSGIGAAVARRIATHSRTLVLTARNESRLADVAHECISRGTDVKCITGDIARSATISALKAQCSHLPPLTGLVNNAGFGAFGDSARFPRKMFSTVLETNVLAPFELAKALLPYLRRDPKSGDVSTIVNVGSDAGVIGFENAAAYCASKGALRLMSAALREEWRKSGIRVTFIAPGRVDTGFNGKSPGMRPGALTAEAVAEVIEFCLFCDPILEPSDIHIDSMQRRSS
ncbi:SDR family NAD(P)-dependent oxidoreductase [Dryocola clanedunensis]